MGAKDCESCSRGSRYDAGSWDRGLVGRRLIDEGWSQDRWSTGGPIGVHAGGDRGAENNSSYPDRETLALHFTRHFLDLTLYRYSCKLVGVK